jgi:uncharacterized membrane protein
MNTTVRWNKSKVREMTILAMFIAIIVVMGFVPNLGFITIAGVSATLIHIPVLIGGAMLGRKSAIILGLAFGFASFARAFTSYGFDFLFVFPWVSILPRFIFGLLIYDGYQLARKVFKNRLVGLIVSFFVLSMIHSLMVLPMMVTAFPVLLGNEGWASLASGASGEFSGALDFMGSINNFSAAFTLITGVLLSNSLVEAILAGSIGAIVTDRLIQSRLGEQDIPETNE